MSQTHPQAEALRALARDARAKNDADLWAGYDWLRANLRWPACRVIYGGDGEAVAGAYWYWTVQAREDSAGAQQLPRGAYLRWWPDGGSETFGAVLEAGARAVGEWLRSKSDGE